MEVIVTRGANSMEDRVDLNPLLAEISARLITVGAQSLPDAPSAQPQRRDDQQILVFTLANKPYGVNIAHIREVVRDPIFTRVPGLPDWVAGVTNSHGEIMSVVDLATFLGIESEAASGKRSMLAAQAGD